MRVLLLHFVVLDATLYFFSAERMIFGRATACSSKTHLSQSPEAQKVMVKAAVCPNEKDSEAFVLCCRGAGALQAEVSEVSQHCRGKRFSPFVATTFSLQ